ncbi:MAG: hypothetical protein UU71_C0040G0005 [Parcubacteria group bacterium GW2011_GWB1_41_6]|uniref:Uncharacterized protein n=1 Tax=Candidatus Daviesbacteria bacterium GW2011_GWC2_40_12 TaxID=1618431 RepID=A0A0G0QKJ5_9BACT|nr:MAG: hypothetical protein UT77_C0020G0005 [Candidatus Daviesbacteria bacterium GW2011_GWC2_40_12]KKS13891.1 MAG: hypothetical protein UU71_C0040G0005 [Parcubacteria group bacterium GW2011_GWB1_41_6]KKS56890.1 MAG: hypothetical protein UV22_C0024G0005 [Parcubacteria group bacterium GW2011_GWA2_42_35]
MKWWVWILASPFVARSFIDFVLIPVFLDIVIVIAGKKLGGRAQLVK